MIGPLVALAALAAIAYAKYRSSRPIVGANPPEIAGSSDVPIVVPPIVPTEDRPLGSATSASYVSTIANGWWPYLSFVDGRLFVACGAAESWLLELDPITLVEISRQRFDHANGWGGQWISPSLLTWFQEGIANGRPAFSRHEVQVLQGPPWISREVAPMSDTRGGNTVYVRDGLICEFTVGQPNRVNGIPVDLNLLASQAELAGGLTSHPAIVNFGAARTADRVYVVACNDNTVILRVNTSNGRIILRPVTPSGRGELNIAIGPGGSVIYGQGDRVYGFAGIEPEIDLTLASWGESPGFVFRGADGQVWIATNSWHEASSRGLVLIRPWGSREAIALERPTIFNTTMIIPGGFVVATNDDRGRMRVDRLAPSTPLRPVLEPPTEPLRPQIAAEASFNAPRWFGLYFDRNDTRYRTEPAPGTCSVLVGVPTLGEKSPQTWGWPFFLAHGPARPVLCGRDVAIDVPDEFLIGILITLEGGPAHMTEAWHAELQANRDYARSRNRPNVVYLDGGFGNDDAEAWARTYLEPTDIPMQMCYLRRTSGSDRTFDRSGIDLAAIADWWRDGLTRLAARHARLAIARTMYTQTWNWHPYDIEAAQPIITAIGNEFGVWGDFGFSWARRSGIIDPVAPAPSIRAVLEPHAIALDRASRDWSSLPALETVT